MSATIDERIVEMKFDNKDFEKNVSTSMTTLEKLQNALKFPGADKSLKDLQSSTRSIDFSSMSNAIDLINNRFSTMGIIGMTVISRLTNAAIDMGKKIVTAIPNQIMTGGWSRATNVEQAKFQLEGLEIAWEEISEDIDYAVRDTAYGADEASKAASMLAASGVNFRNATKDAEGNIKVYSDMGRALRGISGVAAMTNSSYTEMANIFGTVAGQGKLMTQQMRMLEARGLNVAAQMGHVWDKTEAEVRDMVTKGQVSFTMFADAMYDAFGGHATKANETFSGAMANMRASLSRIGQDFAQTIMQQTPQVFNSIKGFFNQIRTYTKPFAENIFTPVFTQNMRILSGVIDHITSQLPKVGKDADPKNIEQYNRVVESFGRILRGFINLIYDLLIAIKPVKDAFKEVFSSLFGVEAINGLESFSKAFESFTEKLAMSSETADKVKRTFKGIFAVFHIVGQAISAIVKAVFPATKSIGDLASGFLDVTASIGDNIVAFDNWIKSSKLFENFATRIVSIISPIFNVVKGAFLGIFDIFTSFSGINFSGLTTTSEKVGAVLDKMHERAKAVGDYLGKFKPLLTAIGNVIRTVVGGSFKLVKNILDNFIEGASFQSLVQILNGIAMGGFTLSVQRMVDTLTGSAQKMIQPFTKISGFIFELKNTLVVFQADLKADILQKLAVAIGILAASLWVLSSIDPKKMAAATAAIGGLAAVLVSSFAVFMKLSSMDISNMSFFKGLKTIAGSLSSALKVSIITKQMLAFAGAIALLSVAVLALSAIPTEKLFTSLIAVIGLMASLVAVMAIFSKFESKITVSLTAVVGLAVAVSILAGALKKVADIPEDDLMKSVIAIGALMLSLTAFMLLMNNFSKFKSTAGDAAVLIAMALSLKTIAGVVKTFAEMELEKLAKGVIAVSASLIVIGAAMKLMGGAGSIGGALSILAMAAALKILSSVIEKFAGIPVNSLAKGLLAFSIAIGEMVLAVLLLSSVGPLALLGAASMVLLAASLSIITGNLALLAKIKASSIAKGLLAIFAALVMVGTLGTILGVVSPLLLLASIGIAAFAKSLLILSAAIGAFALIPFMSILKVLGSLAVVAVALVPISAIFTALSPLLLASAVGLVAFGAGLMALGVGLTIAITGLTSLIGVAGTLYQSLPALVQVIGTMLDATLTAIIEYAPRIVETVVVLIVSFIQTIAEHTQDFIEAGGKLIEGFLTGIANAIPKVLEAAANLILTFIEGLASGIRNNINRVLNAINDLLESIFYAIGRAISNIPEMGKAIVKGFVDGLGINGDAAGEAFKGILDGIFGIITGSLGTIWDLGVQFVNGFIGGIKSLGGAIWDAGCAIVDLATGAVQKTQDSHSPSRVTAGLGRDFANGYTNGIEDGGRASVEAARKLANDSVDALESANDRVDVISKTTANRMIYSSNAALDAWVKNNKLMGESYEETVKGISENGEKIVESLDDISKKHDETYDDIKDKDFGEGIEKTKDIYKEFSDYVAESSNKIVNSYDSVIKSNEKLVESQIKSAHQVAYSYKETANDIVKANEEINNSMTVDNKKAVDSQIQSAHQVAYVHKETYANVLNDTKTTNKEIVDSSKATTDVLLEHGDEIKKNVNSLGNYYVLEGEKIVKHNKKYVDETWKSLKGLDVIWDYLQHQEHYGYDLGRALDAAFNPKAMTDANHMWELTEQNITKSTESIKSSYESLNKSTKDLGNSSKALVEKQIMSAHQMAYSYDQASKAISREAIKDLSSNTALSEKLITKAYNKTAAEGKDALSTLSKSTLEWARSIGLTDKEIAKMFGTTEEVVKEVGKYTEGTEAATAATNGFGGAAKKAKDKFETLGEAIGKVMNSRFSGMTFFEKLELKAETSADSILENMKSNLNGVRDWTDKLSQVAERGLDQGLIQVLAEAGIDSYDQISAFLSMSDEQLQEANALYAQQAQVREDVARRVGVAFKDSGANAVQGLLNGIYEASDQVGGAGEETARTFLTKFNDILDIHSPSGVMRNNGMYIDQGLAQGVSFYKFIPIAECLSLARSIITVLNSALSPSFFVKIGSYVGEGLADGIEKSGDVAIRKAESLAERVAEIMAKTLRIESPSKVTIWLGKMVDEGLAKGISDNSKSVENSSKDLARQALSPIKEAMKTASDYVSYSMDVNPTITPTLDLSSLIGQVDSINSMFADKEMKVKMGSSFKSSVNGSDISEDGSTAPRTNYVFTQNNYSPKALSRLDIYRDSRNLFSSMKGAAQGS